MQRASIPIWVGLLLIAIAMILLYVWFTLVPATPKAEVFSFFSPQQVEQGQVYSRVLRLAFSIGFSVQCGFLAWLLFSGRGMDISQQMLRSVSGRTITGGLCFFIFIWLCLQLLTFPFTFFSSFIWQQQWGFSTQTASSWLLDYLKNAGIELLLAGAGAVLLLQAMHRWSRYWWVAAATFISIWIIVASFLWPVLISPLFNRFTPANDPALTSMVKQLAIKAELPINEILIMDASRRTTRANAYFAGVGETRRVVLYDTLLRDYPADEIESVVAHEFAHWRQGHITQGIIWGALGNFLAWGTLFLLLRFSLTKSGNSPPPHIWLFILLFFYLGSFITLPIQNTISRNMEREADHIAVLLTGNAPAAIRLQVNLAVKNHSDVSPADYLTLFSTHPTAMERILSFQGSTHPLKK